MLRGLLTHDKQKNIKKEISRGTQTRGDKNRDYCGDKTNPPECMGIPGKAQISSENLAIPNITNKTH